ncbi:hypothetical protein [Mycobacterium innocens]|uniref:hypothetical protein n=1 Tax=Mycobacterium innocens TaxID=2341083 RepID=UPI00142DC3CB|nr:MULTISPECIES: hypothetical protein [Mycobacterium]
MAAIRPNQFIGDDAISDGRARGTADDQILLAADSRSAAACLQRSAILYPGKLTDDLLRKAMRANNVQANRLASLMRHAHRSKLLFQWGFGFSTSSLAAVCSALARLAARFCLSVWLDFLPRDWRGDLSDTTGPFVWGLAGPDFKIVRRSAG